MGFLTPEQLLHIRFGKIGCGVRVSERAVFYNPQKIEIGDNSRIDDFTILSAGSGGIIIGQHVHIACHSTLIGRGKITLDDYCNLSSRVSIYSSSDDYSGDFMTNPTIPEKFTNVKHADVYIGRHVIIGCGTVVLPGVSLSNGSGTGALSLVKSNVPERVMVAGVPAKIIGKRSAKCFDFEEQMKVGIPV